MPVLICTNLSLTGSWYKYVQISPSPEAGTNMYKSLSHGKPVQIPLSQEAGTYMYKFEISHQNPVQICTNLSITGSWYKYICTNFFLTQSRYEYVQIYL